MLREYTCIICPNGCDIRAQIEEGEDGSRRICSVEGAACPKGRAYVEQELTDPQRNIATSVLVKGGILPLASVRLTNPIPRDRIFDAVSEIKKYTLTAPVKAGTVVIPRLMGYDTDVIVTKSVPENR
ncbi:DUF1667 domain-containing protein [Enterocloster bolteae]|uniref:DUF1667 domain-containing protein n=1 Tax=Enterocloster bolteae TaxID=208479 RepID=UPI0003F9492E|nr:DUF1667 domain-containing protein [Enterocloster bolteae]UOX69866.1 DUF1667 domain-containing protein [Enterocloster bolteae]